jgi:hypothetical protein
LRGFVIRWYQVTVLHSLSIVCQPKQGQSDLGPKKIPA